MAKKTRKPKEPKTTNDVVSADVDPVVPPGALDPDPEPEQPIVTSSKAVRAEAPPEPAPKPEGVQVGDRVHLPDYGSRAGVVEEIDDEKGLLLVKLDVPADNPFSKSKQDWAITVQAPNGQVIRTRMIEIEKSRAVVEAGSRK